MNMNKVKKREQPQRIMRMTILVDTSILIPFLTAPFNHLNTGGKKEEKQKASTVLIIYRSNKIKPGFWLIKFQT